MQCSSIPLNLNPVEAKTLEEFSLNIYNGAFILNLKCIHIVQHVVLIAIFTFLESVTSS